MNCHHSFHMYFCFVSSNVMYGVCVCGFDFVGAQKVRGALRAGFEDDI